MNVVRQQEPDLWDARLEEQIVEMLEEAVDCEAQFAEDLLSGGVAGLSVRDMRAYLGYVADSRLQRLGIAPHFNTKNPFSFMELQDVQELTNFFERRVSAYQTAVAGEVAFGEDFYCRRWPNSMELAKKLPFFWAASLFLDSISKGICHFIVPCWPKSRWSRMVLLHRLRLLHVRRQWMPTR